MRIKNEKEDIKYDGMKAFFRNRAKKYQKDNPYSVTMYQDNNPELVKARNKSEIEKLLPKLCLAGNSRVLDVACGIGRWAEAIRNQGQVEWYCGVDFSEELINIANERNEVSDFSFYAGSALELQKVLGENKVECLFNVVLIVGIQVYFNDIDIPVLLQQVCGLCDEHAVICMREPIGIDGRLTLKEFYSEELQDNYNAIYRTHQEHQLFYDNILLPSGFNVTDEGFLFEEPFLNNRKETAQYYWIFER